MLVTVVFETSVADTEDFPRAQLGCGPLRTDVLPNEILHLPFIPLAPKLRGHFLDLIGNTEISTFYTSILIPVVNTNLPSP